MNKTYRFLGNRGRTTIPYSLCSELGLHRNDLVSFERNGDTVVIRKEKICDGCADDLEHTTNHTATAEKTQKKQIIKTSGARKMLKLQI